MTQQTEGPRVINKVGIITKRNIGDNVKFLKKVVKHLKTKKVEVIFDNNLAPIFKVEGMKKKDILVRADLVLCMGGDGTLLKTARRLGRRKTLILGINLGTLGFLTESTKDKALENIDRVFEGRFDRDKRSVLRVTVYRDGKKLNTFLALNDAAINQGAFARLIRMDMEIDHRKVATVHADGLIVATPTGSTGHSLSAGGPIVHPKIEGLVITPICPSSLAMRPIIVPDNRQLTITIETARRDELAILGLTLDGQDMMTIKYGDVIKIRRSKRSLYFVRTGNRYYKMLRGKLHWGEMRRPQA